METGLNKNYTDKGSYSLCELGRLLDAEVKGDLDLRIRGIGPLDAASPDQLSFLSDPRNRQLLSGCRAAAIIVPSECRDLDLNLLICKNPYLAFAKAAQLFAAGAEGESGIHPDAFVGNGVRLGESVGIGPLAHVGDNRAVGHRTYISAGVYVGKDVHIGERCLIHPRVSILDGCIIGDRVIIQSGAVIGADGFGYAHDEQGRQFKIPQKGIVQVDDDVEIGANTTIDRATFGKTWIKRGAKIDNLVMIAHHVVVGEDCVFAAQVGIAGSTQFGNQVVLGGQVGIAGHIQIGDRVKIGAKSGILHSIKPGTNIMGIPGVEYDDWFRTYANMQRLPRLKDQLKRLGEKVQRLEEALKGDDGHRSD